MYILGFLYFSRFCQDEILRNSLKVADFWRNFLADPKFRSTKKNLLKAFQEESEKVEWLFGCILDSSFWFTSRVRDYSHFP